MKSIVIFFLLALFLFRCSENPHHDPEIVKYITEKEGYVKLTDKENLPTDILNYHSTIIEFMKFNWMDIDDYFVDTSHCYENDSTMEIPIYHYDGYVRLIEIEMEYQNRQVAKKSTNPDGGYQLRTQLKGNASGKDGYLLIDKRIDMCIGFSKWK